MIIDMLNRSIEFVLQQQEEDFEYARVLYQTASVVLRRVFIEETGTLYLAVPSKYKDQKPLLVAIPTEL